MSPIVVATALSLYVYNVSPGARARDLYDHFKGNCMDLEDIEALFERRPMYAATDLPHAMAVVYVRMAIEMYGAQAEERCRINAGMERVRNDAR
jgi:hypothetical protein